MHVIDLSGLRPMVAEPGDPTYGKDIVDLGDVEIDIAYAGSAPRARRTTSSSTRACWTLWTRAARWPKA